MVIPEFCLLVVSVLAERNDVHGQQGPPRDPR